MASEWAIAKAQAVDGTFNCTSGLEEAAEIARSLAEIDDPGCLCGKCLTSGLIEIDTPAAIAKEPTA